MPKKVNHAYCCTSFKLHLSLQSADGGSILLSQGRYLSRGIYMLRLSPYTVYQRVSIPENTGLDEPRVETTNCAASTYGGYYSDILAAPSQPYNPSRTPQPQPTSPPETQAEPQKEQTPQEKFGIVFGTRLAGPGYSSTRYNPSTTPKSAWRTVNGVPIPPRPEEPDNCCMSGCVHCVWDDYRDDVEAWAQRINEAKKRDPPRRGSRKKKAAGPLHDMRQSARKEVDSASASMDDDGGGSQSTWNTDISADVDADADALFADIPVGIREFMKTEKKLREKRKKAEDKA
ncbi:conserved hypothetical protein [Microsporum canis CBS 113480]|uniref:Oxidoreductase-like domain-containing protein n=1 Tax=Arthroderma otae (strain ATCC MYA-4605 / CBS 113480) TaxID=554155 RepID=C5FJ86_ARTOC|nr:conserved hypothetical protein [Microsporum canis CBS 113480]EEQ29507.1 conserved hypothetical protein [Microsporum canis CBS 113480]